MTPNTPATERLLWTPLRRLNFRLRIEILHDIEFDAAGVADRVTDAILHYEKQQLFFPGAVPPDDHVLGIKLALRSEKIVESSGAAGGEAPRRAKSGLSDEVMALIAGIRDADEYLRRQEAKIWTALHRVDGARSEAVKTAARENFLTVLHDLQTDERLRRCLGL